MFSVYDGYKKIETGGEKTYFAGANTADGFVGLYSDIANERKLDRAYIIKGAAGTGKSTLMKKIADSCKKSGYESEYYLCGSDPFSYDCVVIDKRIAVLDGTSPHQRDMQYPGCASSIIDLSRFWDNGILEESKDEIIYYSAKKAADYAAAYRFIKAADQLDRERYLCACDYFDRDKAEAYIDRLLKKLKVKHSANPVVRRRYTHGITMRGRWCVDVTEDASVDSYSVFDIKNIAPLFMELVAEKAKAEGLSHTVSYMPLRHNITAVSLDDHDITFNVSRGRNDEKSINSKRFDKCDSSVDGRMKLAGRCEKECIEDAETILSSAAENHFRLEEIYKKSMDFERLAEYTDEVTDEILERLKKRN